MHYKVLVTSLYDLLEEFLRLVVKEDCIAITAKFLDNSVLVIDEKDLDEKVAIIRPFLDNTMEIIALAIFH